MFDISPLQIGIVLLLALLVFGPRRLPELGRGLGSGIRDFKEGLTGPSERDAAEHPAAAAVDPEPAAASRVTPAADAAPEPVPPAAGGR
ncbi:MAG: twin-arginine translocase TatA/TatE family subunit [Acidimicrobiales bacterium]